MEQLANNGDNDGKIIFEKNFDLKDTLSTEKGTTNN